MESKILVIGDTILDEYVYVNPRKISDEAHVITSNVVSKKYVLGGGANVARNVSSLGGDCTYLGLTSNMVNGDLQKCLDEYDLKSVLFKTKNSVQVKTRIISTRGSQISRFDSLFEEHCTGDIINEILNYLNQHINEFNFIIISKYYNFFLTKKVIFKILTLAKKNKIKVLVDNRQSNAEDFKNVDFYKVNFNEFTSIYKIIDLDNTREQIERTIVKNGLNVNCLLITRSALPTIICYKDKLNYVFIEVPVEEVKVSDVSGAGDTFVAAFAVNFNPLIENNDLLEIVKTCHKVCNLVVKKMGTNVVWTYEFNANISLDLLSQQLKKNNKKLVFTNGVFDILHSGHVKLLEEAKALGDYLIVGINSDESVHKLKGPTRPINDEQERKKVLESLRYVDKVIIFNKLTVSYLLKKIKPDIYIKGGDYTVNTLPEKQALKYVGKVHFIKTIVGKSSSNTIKKIKSID